MIYLSLLGCLVAIILEGFFAASEISFISSSTLQLRHRQLKGDQKAKKVYEFIKNPERFLATTLVGTNVSLVLSTSLLTFILAEAGIENSNLWTTFIFTPFIVIFAELVPKNIGRFFSQNFSYKSVELIEFFTRLFSPIVITVEVASKALVRIFIKKTRFRSPFVTKEEIKQLVREIEIQGGIDRGEKEAIEEVMGFRKDTVKDFCVKTKKIIAFDYTDSLSSIFAIVRKYRFTRYLVFRNKEVLGFVNIYDLFYSNQTDSNWQQFIRPITKVGFNQKLHEVFATLKNKRENIALVLKGKKTYGIITLEDIIREIVTVIIKS